TALNNGALQEFVFPGGPVRARFVRLLARNNYGSLTSIRVATFEAVAVRSDGNIVSLPGTPPSVVRNASPAQIANGATVVAFSSAFNTAHQPPNMLDYVFGNPWAT